MAQNIKKNVKEDKKVIPASGIKPLYKGFSIDINNLAKYLKGAQDQGKEYIEVIVPVNNDLDIFVEAIIRKYKDGRLTVEFRGDRAELTTPLVKFIDDCAKLYGPTLTGEGPITKADYEALTHETFSRMWDKVCVTMYNNELNKTVMVLIFFNPPQLTLASNGTAAQKTKSTSTKKNLS